MRNKQSRAREIEHAIGQTKRIRELEEQLAEALLESDRLERQLADEQTTNRELRERIATLETRPTVSGVNWSRERDHTGEA